MNVLVIVNDLTPRDLIKLTENTNEYEEISLLYVKPNLPSCYYSLSIMTDIEAHAKQEANSALQFVGNVLRVPKKNQWSTTGHVNSQAKYLAENIDADMILATQTVYNQFNSKQLKLKHLTCMIRLIQGAIETTVKKSMDPFILVGHAIA